MKIQCEYKNNAMESSYQGASPITKGLHFGSRNFWSTLKVHPHHQKSSRHLKRRTFRLFLTFYTASLVSSSKVPISQSSQEILHFPQHQLLVLWSQKSLNKNSAPFFGLFYPTMIKWSMIDNQITTWSVGLWSSPDITVSWSSDGMSLKNVCLVMLRMMLRMMTMLMRMMIW